MDKKRPRWFGAFPSLLPTILRPAAAGEPSVVSQDITSTIERLEAIEDQVGIEFGGFSAFVDNERFDEADEAWVTVRGELTSTDSGEISDDLEIQFAAYDDKSRVVGTTSHWIFAESFLGIDIFDVSFKIEAPVVRLRVYPKRH